MTKIALFLLATLFLSASAFDETQFTREDGILVITNENFMEAFNNISYFMIEFYAPWCGHCKKFAPEYARIAQSFHAQGSPVEFGKVNVEDEPEMAQKFGIDGYPTLIWVENQKMKPYKQEREEKYIIDFIKRRTSSVSRYAETFEQLSEAIKQTGTAFIFWGDEFDPMFNLYESANKDFMDHQFFHTPSEEFKAKTKADDDVRFTVLKAFDEKVAHFTEELSEEALIEFFNSHSHPKFVDIGDKYMKIIFGDFTDAVFLIRNKGDESERAIEAMKQVQNEMAGKTIFGSISVDTTHGEKVAKFYQVEREEIPALVAIKFRSAQTNKYIHDGPITPQGVLDFYNGIQSKKILPQRRSEAIPEYNDNIIKAVVGKTFTHIVEDPTKNVLIYLYPEGCEHCRGFTDNVLQKIAYEKQDMRDLRFCKLLISMNDIPGKFSPDTETIAFYPKNNKSNPVIFNGNMERDNIANWLNAQLK